MSPCPTPVASTAAIHSLLHSWIGSSLKPGSTLIFQQELREYPIQFITYHRRTPPPPPVNLLWEELWKITKLIQLNYCHSHSQQTGLIPEVPDPHKSCKKVSPSRPPLLPLQWISRWCKECPLTKRVNWIIAHTYGEPKSIFTESTFSWKGFFFLSPTWSDIICSRIKPLNQNGWSWYHFSQEKIPIHWYQSLYTYISGSMPFRYFRATLYTCIPPSNFVWRGYNKVPKAYACINY